MEGVRKDGGKRRVGVGRGGRGDGRGGKRHEGWEGKWMGGLGRDGDERSGKG